jgi:hypothetical protein
MKNRITLIIAALLVSLFTGCSKHPPAAAASPKVTNLGVVEVSDGGTNRVDLGDGRVCVIKSFILKDQKVTIDQKETTLKGVTIALMINIDQTDFNGVTQLLISNNIMASSDQTVGFSDGVTSVRLTPHIKQ